MGKKYYLISGKSIRIHTKCSHKHWAFPNPIQMIKKKRKKRWKKPDLQAKNPTVSFWIINNTRFQQLFWNNKSIASISVKQQKKIGIEFFLKLLEKILDGSFCWENHWENPEEIFVQNFSCNNFHIQVPLEIKTKGWDGPGSNRSSDRAPHKHKHFRNRPRTHRS